MSETLQMVKHYLELAACTAPEAYAARQQEIADWVDRKVALGNQEALDRLRTIVDEEFGMQPVMGWEELLDVLEKELFQRRQRRQLLGDAVHDLHRLVPPDRLVLARGRTHEAIAMIEGETTQRQGEDPK